ncbi:DUF354 domain-containing protein [Halobacteriales archaeon Cl-PHB]
MHAIVTIQHPAHVHFYRNAIADLEERGHEVTVFAREKDLVADLLQAYGIEHTVLAGEAGSTLGLLGVQVAYELRLLRAVRQLDPDVLTAVGGVAVSHVAALTDARSVVFIDNEGVASNYLTVPVADEIFTPRRFAGDLGSGHHRYDGYHELAYLHPEQFDPDPGVIRSYGIDPDDPYSVVRFVGWGAHHDVGEAGISVTAKRDLIDLLKRHGDVYVTAEGNLPPVLEDCRLPVAPEEVHHLLWAADCYVGDSQTMATEAALLGTPAVRSNSFAGAGDMSNFVELAARYGLVISTDDETEAMEAVSRILSREDSEDVWERRREALLNDKIDVTSFLVDALLAAADRPPAATDAVASPRPAQATGRGDR